MTEFPSEWFPKNEFDFLSEIEVYWYLNLCHYARQSYWSWLTFSVYSVLCLLLSLLQLLCRKISWLAHLSFLLLPISGKGGCSWHLQVLQLEEKEYSLSTCICLSKCYQCYEYVSLSVISRGRALTSPLIIPDITKTSSNNCLLLFNKFAHNFAQF